MENVNTKRFKDLKVGDTIYVTDRWDFYKLTIAEISIDSNDMDKCMKITFLDDCEFAYCDNALDIDSCFQIDKGYMEDFCIECYRDCLFFADKEECRRYLETLQKRAGDALDKLDKCHYSWKYIVDTGEFRGQVFDTREECYSEMRKNALLKLDSLTCDMTKKCGCIISCEVDHIKIISGLERWDWFMIEV